jgi:ClpP class serine protease
LPLAGAGAEAFSSRSFHVLLHLGFVLGFFHHRRFAADDPAVDREFRAQRKIMQIESKRGSRVILLVHRQETMRLLGFPVLRYIDVNDSEDVLRAIQMTRDDVPLDIMSTGQPWPTP